ncbi:MAG: proton-conducting transporter membrane subunit [candidate division WOR-3 bacterium]
MNPLLLVVIIPILMAFLGLIIGRLRNELNFLGGLLTLYYSFRIFLIQKGRILEYPLGNVSGIEFKLQVDNLSGFILFFASLFGFLIIVYSLRYCRRMELLNLRSYYFYLLLTVGGANGVLLSNNLFLLLIFWGFLLAVLYGLFLIGKNDPSYAWRKTLTIIGTSDFLLLLGIILLFIRFGNVGIIPKSPLSLSDTYLLATFILITIGALAKAGAMPLHSWIPEAAKVLPASVMALIPASLDKLLGIYLLARVSIYIFDIRTNMVLRNFLMIIGAVTVLAAVMMAIIQKEAMRLLSFHAVSQVGYMVLGIGTGIPVGIAGGIFHMLNNALYKSGLFLTSGSVESWTKDTKLDNLGGLATKMPITFFSFLVCALAISGVPPLNGFFSKWLIYQGILELGREGNRLFVIYLIAAMIGSVLTLASFLKLTHALFLGERPKGLEKIREVGFSMWLPGAIIALLCLLFGIFAYLIPIRHFINPSLPYPVVTIGRYQPILATILILIGLLVGFTIYRLLVFSKKTKVGEVFLGGERLLIEERRLTGVHFYSSLKDLPILEKLYQFGEGGAFDFFNYLVGIMQTLGLVFQKIFHRLLEEFYRFLAQIVNFFSVGISQIQNGFLPFYLAWMVIGALLLFLFLIR